MIACRCQKWATAFPAHTHHGLDVKPHYMGAVGLGASFRAKGTVQIENVVDKCRGSKSRKPNIQNVARYKMSPAQNIAPPIAVT